MADIIDAGELDLNTILEQSKGVGKEKVFSAAKARKRGKGKGRFKFFIVIQVRNITHGLIEQNG